MATTNPTIVFAGELDRQVCTVHGDIVQRTNRAGAHCWRCDGYTPATCEHGIQRTVEIYGYGGGRHSWNSVNECPQCAAVADEALAARVAAAAEQKRREELAAAEREIAQRRINEARQRSLVGDERRMYARRPGFCTVCGQPFPAGRDIAWSKARQETRHIDCRMVIPDGMRILDCGCIVDDVPGASMGTASGSSCPDCYDRMDGAE